MAFQLTRQRNELRLRRARVVTNAEVTPGYRRITLGGADLIGFDSPGWDDHVKIFLPPTPGAPLTLPEVDENGVRQPVDGARPMARDYTPVAWDAELGTLTLEFVVHGDGVASRWAERARPGDEIGVGGPRGSRILEGDPEWWLLAGDLTALPAIRRHLAEVPAGAEVLVIVSSDDPADRQELRSDGDLLVRWVTAADAGDQAALLDALGMVTPRPGAGFAFVAAEQSVVKPARELFLNQWAMDPDSVVVKGYWKRGEADYHAPR